MMLINYKKSISILLLLSCGLLGVLVPGGSVETRDFSHINPFTLGCFNTFLTLLVMISVLIVYYLLQEINWSYLVAAICGLSYFVVYALDLAKIFPVSPAPMPQTLFIIEVIGLIVSLPIMFLSIKELSFADSLHEQKAQKIYSQSFVYFALLLSIASLVIIIFATKSAMGI